MSVTTNTYKRRPLSVSSGSSNVIAFSALRGSMSTNANAIYTVKDAGKEGDFLLDPTDTTSPDNTGTVVVSSNGLRFKRQYTGPILLSWFDIVPGDITKAASNALKMDTVLRSVNHVHLLLPPGKTSNIYYLDKVPNSGFFVPNIEEAAMTMKDRSILFEMGEGVAIEVLPGVIGLQTGRTTGESYVRLKNFRMYARGGKNSVPNYRKLENGQYSEDWGSYKINGINFWSQGEWENINIGGFPGHGACVFGNTTIKVNGPNIPVTGTVGMFNGQNNFTPDTPEMLAQLFGTMKIVVNGKLGAIGGKNGNFVTIGGFPNNEILPSGHYDEVYAYQTGKTLFADHIQASGFNEFNANGGCGIFTTGDEANAGSFDNISCRDNGGPGIVDSSLLGNYWKGYHLTANGKHFNDFTVYPPVLKLGAGSNFSNRGNPNTRSTLTMGYTEGGNAAPSHLNGQSLILGGIIEEGAGVQGGFGITEGGHMHNLYSGFRSNNPGKIQYEHEITFNNTDESYKITPWGRGWAFTDESGIIWSATRFVQTISTRVGGLRKIINRFLQVNNLVIDGHFYGYRNNMAEIKVSNQSYRAGDTFMVETPTPQGVKGWYCVQGGSYEVIDNTLTANTQSTAIAFNKAPVQLVPGDTILINGTIATVMGNLMSGFTTTYESSVFLPNLTNATITFRPPSWQPIGFGMGTAAQRPSLEPESAGFRYFSTDNSIWTTWTGTAWI